MDDTPAPRNWVRHLAWLTGPRALALALFAAYWDSWWWLWRQCSGGAAYSLFVLAVAVYLVWRELERPPEYAPPRSVRALGAVLLLTGMGFHLAATPLHWSHPVAFLTLLPCAAGLLLMVGGARALGRVWLAAPLVAVSVPALAAWAALRMGPAWQLYSSAMAAILASACGVQVVREGTSLHLPQTTLQVAPQCSGLQTLIGILALVAAIAAVRRARGREAALALGVSVPLSLFINSLRLTSVLLLGRSLEGAALQRIHDGLELPTMLVAAFVGVGLAQRLATTRGPEANGDQPVGVQQPAAGLRRPTRMRLWVLAALCLLGAEAVRVPLVWQQARHAARLEDQDLPEMSLPGRVGEWRAGTHRNFGSYINWSYRNRADLRVEVLVKRGQQVTPLECALTQGFPVVVRPKRVEVMMGGARMGATHMVIQRPADRRLLTVMYWVRNQKGFLPDPPLTFIAGVPELVWDDPAYTDALFVRFLVVSPAATIDADVASQCDLMDRLFPALDSECVRVLKEFEGE